MTALKKYKNQDLSIEKTDILKLEYEFFLNFESPHTRKSYKNDIHHFSGFMKEFFPTDKFLDVNKFHIVAYKNNLTELDYSPKSINRKLSSISAYFNFLIEKGFLEQNPTLGIRRPRQTVRKETEDLTDEEVIKLFEIVNEEGSPLHRAIVYLFFSTGIRKSELIELKRKNFKLINNYMTITVKAKGGKVLTKVLPQETSEVMNEYLFQMERIGREVHPEDWFFQPSKNPSVKNANLTKPLRPKSVDYIIKKYCKLAGIFKRITPHSARATYIGSAIENGCNIIKISKDVGHSSIRTTETYNKRRNKMSDSPIHNLGFIKK